MELILTAEELQEWIDYQASVTETARHLSWISGGVEPLRLAHEQHMRRLVFLRLMQANALAQ